MKRICIVFVSNLKYINHFIKSYYQLINYGNYKEDVCLIIGNDLYNTEIIENIKSNIPSLIIFYKKDIIFNDNFYTINNKIICDGRNITKKFQWHKLHIFDVYFKNWNYILYNLANLYPISKTNEQGIIALYFTNIYNKFKVIPISNNNFFLYDYCIRDFSKKYIMNKY